MKQKIIYGVVVAGCIAVRVCAAGDHDRQASDLFVNKPYMQGVKRSFGEWNSPWFGWDTVRYEFANSGPNLGCLTSPNPKYFPAGLWIDPSKHLCVRYKPCESKKCRLLGVPIWRSASVALILRTKQPVVEDVLLGAALQPERQCPAHVVKPGQSPKTIPSNYKLSAAVLRTLDAGTLSLTPEGVEWEPVTQTAAGEGQQAAFERI